MSNILSPNSKFYSVLNWFADLLILNLLFLLTSIPLVTVGASLTALYTVVFRIGTPEEGSVVRAYFEAFKSNFKNSTVIWLILLAVFVICGVDLLVAANSEGLLRSIRFVFWAAILLGMMAMCYAFPLTSRFENRPLRTLKNALLLSIAYFPRSLLMLLVNLLPVIVLMVSLEIFVITVWFFVILYFAFAALINCKILRSLFDTLAENAAKEV